MIICVLQKLRAATFYAASDRSLPSFTFTDMRGVVLIPAPSVFPKCQTMGCRQCLLAQSGWISLSTLVVFG